MTPGPGETPVAPGVDILWVGFRTHSRLEVILQLSWRSGQKIILFGKFAFKWSYARVRPPPPPPQEGKGALGVRNPHGGGRCGASFFWGLLVEASPLRPLAGPGRLCLGC